MAQATIKTHTIETPVQEVITVMKKEEKNIGVTLELTMEEAEFLRFLMGRVGGHDEGSPNRYGRSIKNALSAAGFFYDRDRYALAPRHPYSNVVFFLNDRTEEKLEAPEVAPQGTPQEPRVGDIVEVVDSLYTGVHNGEKARVIEDRGLAPEGGWRYYVKPLEDAAHRTLRVYGFDQKHLKVVPEEAPQNTPKPCTCMDCAFGSLSNTISAT